MSRILVVDDDKQLLRAMRINLTARGYEVVLAPDGVTALAAATKQPPDLVIVDLGLPDMDGVEVIEGIRGLAGRADHRAVRASSGTGQGTRARRRRRRLHHEAVRHGRAAGPDPGGAAAGGSGVERRPESR